MLWTRNYNKGSTQNFVFRWYLLYMMEISQVKKLHCCRWSDLQLEIFFIDHIFKNMITVDTNEYNLLPDLVILLTSLYFTPFPLCISLGALNHCNFIIQSRVARLAWWGKCQNRSKNKPDWSNNAKARFPRRGNVSMQRNNKMLVPLTVIANCNS